MLRRVLPLAVRAALTGTLVASVVVAGGCSADFLPGSVIVSSRVLAVTANPPEAVPGEQVTLEPLVVSPQGELVPGDGDGAFRAEWWRCPDTDSDALGDFAQCTNPSERVDLAEGSPYVDTVPPDLFGELPAPGEAEEELPSDKMLGALLGYWRVVGMTMRTDGDDGAERKVEAFKRIPVYLPVRLGDIDPRLAALDTHVAEDGTVKGPNTNPTLSAVLIHEGKADGPTTTTLDPKKSYFFAPIFDDDTLEDYVSLKVDLEGLDLSDPASLQQQDPDDFLKRFEKVQRCEIPTFSWFVTHGRLRRETTLDEGVLKRVYDVRKVDCPPVEGEARTAQAEYTPPTGEEDDPMPEDGVVHGWVVMRDGRGGTATRSFDFVIRK